MLLSHVPKETNLMWFIYTADDEFNIEKDSLHADMHRYTSGEIIRSLQLHELEHYKNSAPWMHTKYWNIIEKVKDWHTNSCIDALVWFEPLYWFI